MNSIFGLDIGADTVKMLQFANDHGKFRLISAGITKNPLAGYLSSSDKEMAPLVEVIKGLKKDAGITTDLVSVSLSEKDVFIQTLEVPKMAEAELDQAVKWEAESVIPKPIAEVSFDWRVVQDEKAERNGKIKLLIIAAPLSLLSSYLKTVKMAGLKAVSVESESLALIRCLREAVGQKNALLFNWGLKSADIVLMRKGDFYLNRSISVTGEALTRAISVELGLDMVSAEEYKKTYGLSTELEGKVGKAVQPLLAASINEIKKAINFFEEKEQEKINLMILSGGSSLFYGVAEYFTQALGIEVQVANPFFSLQISPEQAEAFKKSVPVYSVAAGLAMKET